MSRRSALLILVAVSLTAAIVLAQTPPDWWIPFDDKGDDPGNGNGGDEKEPFSFDPPEWWPEFQPKDITNSSI